MIRTCDLCDEQFDPEADDDWFHGMNLGTETTACPACVTKSYRRNARQRDFDDDVDRRIDLRREDRE